MNWDGEPANLIDRFQGANARSLGEMVAMQSIDEALALISARLLSLRFHEHGSINFFHSNEPMHLVTLADDKKNDFTGNGRTKAEAAVVAVYKAFKASS